MTEEKKVVIVSCSGASNTGDIADELARVLVEENPAEYDMLCLAAYAIKRPPSLKKVSEAKSIIVIDGCSAKCASKILEAGGVKPDTSIEVSADFQVKKNMEHPRAEESEVQRVKGEFKKKVQK